MSLGFTLPEAEPSIHLSPCEIGATRLAAGLTSPLPANLAAPAAGTLACNFGVTRPPADLS